MGTKLALRIAAHVWSCRIGFNIIATEALVEIVQNLEGTV
jgi:hypothetical protein